MLPRVPGPLVARSSLRLCSAVAPWRCRYQADLDFEGTGEYVPDLGRTPQSAGEPMLQQVRASTGYQIRADDKK